MIDAKVLMLEAFKKYADANKWIDATYEHIKRISNSNVGAVGQDFIENLACAYEFQCEFPINTQGKRKKQSPWDIQINGVKFELKTATEDVGGAYQFNHIRYHRPYEAVLCLGISPEDIHFNLWSKADILTGKAGNLVSMEKGANASYKLTKKPKDLFDIGMFKEKLDFFFSTYKR